MTATQEPSAVTSAKSEAPIYIRPDSPDYESVRAFLRSSRRDSATFERRATDATRLRTSWLEQVPEPLRSGLRSVILDVAGRMDFEIGDALADVLFEFADEAAGHTVDDLEELTEEVLRRPITIVDALERVARHLGTPAENWLNDRDLVTYRKVADSAG